MPITAFLICTLKKYRWDRQTKGSQIVMSARSETMVVR